MSYMHKYNELRDKEIRDYVHTWREEGYLQAGKKISFSTQLFFVAKFLFKTLCMTVKDTSGIRNTDA